MKSLRRFVEGVVLSAILCLAMPLLAAIPPLHVDGNKIKDPSGNVVVLRGIALIDLGFLQDWQGGAINMINRLTDKTDDQGESPGWYPKIIRINVTPPDSVSGWPHPFNPGNTDLYDLLRTVVDYCATKDMYCIIDWHYIANTYDHVASTSEFWTYMAPRFADDDHVFFELFNEPINNTFGSDAANWANVKTNMQTWIDIVRTYAPNNIILVAGPNWSQAIGPIASNPPTGSNIAVVSHIYPGHWRSPSWYQNHITTCAAVFPIMMTEWGFSQSGSPDPGDLLNGTITEYGQPLSDFRELYDIGHTAWVASYDWGPPMFWDPGSPLPSGTWDLRIGEGEMGGFTKDLLYEFKDADQPGGDTTPPAAPTGLSAVEGDEIVSLNWNDNTEGDLDGYNVYRSTVSGGPYFKQNTSLLSSSDYTDNDVTNGTTYYYVVTAVDTSSNESDNSNQASATPYADTTPPAAPTGLSAIAGEGTVSLDWNNNGEGDLAGYNIYRSTSPGVYTTPLNGLLLSSSDYTDNSVVNGTTYYYVVRAVDTSSNESGNSNQVSATPVDLPPAAPTGLAATAGNGTVSLDWNNNTEGDLDGYNIYRSTTSGVYTTPLNGSPLGSSDYTDNSVVNGTTYYYVVTAVDTGTNESGASSEVSAMPELRTDIEILGDPNWVTGLNHTAEAGTNRALIFVAHDEQSATINLSSVTYGGQPMTKVIDRIVTSSSTYAYVVAYILDEADVAAATNSTFTPTWSATPSNVGYASVFLGNVDQTTIVGPNDSNGTTSGDTNLDPIKTNPLATSSGDMVIMAATCGNSGSYTLGAGFTEGIDQTMGGTATGVTGHKLATGADETPSADYSASINRQVIIGFVVNAKAATGYSNCSEVLTAGYRLAADISGAGNCYVDYEDLDTFVDYWLNDTCTGPDNCHGADFKPADGVVDLLDFSDFAKQWLVCNDPEDLDCSPNW